MAGQETRAFRSGTRGRGLLLGLVATALLLLPAGRADTTSAGRPLDRIVGDFEAVVLAEGLVSPDGLAVHPLTGELYVSEEDAGRISVIRNGRPQSALRADWYVDDRLPTWAISEARPREHWLHPKLNSPEGIAFSPNGRLYVVEDTPHGRLLEFFPEADGTYARARAIPIPWLDEPFAWESVVVARDGRLYLAGSSLEAGLGLFYGGVATRSPGGRWAVIDYGPFASFSSVCLSRDQDILVVGEEISGSVTWWDAVRRLPMETVSERTPSVESICVMPDGGIVLAQEAGPAGVGGGPAGGRLLRVNPQTGQTKIIAQGFKSIETLIVAPDGERFYLTEDGTGCILELRPKEPFRYGEYLLRRSERTYEVLNGLPPKRWPAFLKPFFSKLGVPTRDETAATGEVELGRVREKTAFSVQDLATRIPFIAGKVRAEPLTEEAAKDPVAQLDFIIFFPNQMVKNGIISPSLSLFSAKRQSGKLERSRVLKDMVSLKRTFEGVWTRDPTEAQVTLPLTSCSAVTNEHGMDVSLTFLGLGFTPDYYFSVSIGAEITAHLVVDEDGTLLPYRVSVTEVDSQGAEQINVVVAGVEARPQDEPAWLDIGNYPLSWNLISGPQERPWVSHWVSRQFPDLLVRLRGDEQKLNMAVIAPPEDLDEEPPFKPIPVSRTGVLLEEPPATLETPRVRPPAKVEKEEQKEDGYPAAANKPPPPSVTRRERDEEPEPGEPSWTNLILSRAIAAWREQQF